MVAVTYRFRLIIIAVVGMLVVGGCDLLFSPAGDLVDIVEGEVAVQESGGDRFPDVLEVRLEAAGDRTFDVSVTLSSPYDTPQRYADGWQTLDADGNVLGTHTLLHDHAAEQPFTRVQRGVVIPDGVAAVTVQGRDQANGFGGLTLTVAVPDGS
jgi:hypothetical protein